MVNRLVVCSVLLSSLGVVACSPSSADGPDDSHPAWIGGQLRSESKTTWDEIQVENITLKPDGSGTDTWRTFNADVPGDEPYDRVTHVEWSLKGTTLKVGDLSYRMSVSANCHLVQLGDRIYHNGGDGPIAACPYPDAPLTTTEASLLGSWSGGGLFVNLNDSRLLMINVEVVDTYLAYSVGDDGTLHGTSPDGTELLTVNLEKNASGWLKWCDRGKCILLKPSS